jgi:hypothetical protein
MPALCEFTPQQILDKFEVCADIIIRLTNGLEDTSVSQFFPDEPGVNYEIEILLKPTLKSLT